MNCKAGGITLPGCLRLRVLSGAGALGTLGSLGARGTADSMASHALCLVWSFWLPKDPSVRVEDQRAPRQRVASLLPTLSAWYGVSGSLRKRGSFCNSSSDGKLKCSDHQGSQSSSQSNTPLGTLVSLGFRG